MWAVFGPLVPNIANIFLFIFKNHSDFPEVENYVVVWLEEMYVLHFTTFIDFLCSCFGRKKKAVFGDFETKLKPPRSAFIFVYFSLVTE
jgi:hypothetical protein